MDNFSPTLSGLGANVPPGLPPGVTDYPVLQTPVGAPPSPYANTARMIELFKQYYKESFEYRWVWEREWIRDIFYIMNRQWISYHPTRREWIDKRLQKWVPRPVTNKMAETLQAIRTNLGAINLIVKVRPVGNDTASIATAEIADQMAPLIHEEHMMDQVMREADFWLIATGNAVLQTSWDKDVRWNRVFIQNEQCMSCGQVAPPKAIVDAGHHCPTCGSGFLQPAIEPNQVDPTTGEPAPSGQWVSFGKGKTTALSPFEFAFPPNVTRFDELPYIIRMRWKDKNWFEANRPDLLTKIVWEKSPSDRSLQIFKSLSLTNDIGTGSQYTYLGSAGAAAIQGITEYEVWLRPTLEFPQGLVFRVLGERDPIILDSPEENLPGPIPYTDIEGNALWPFQHAQYEHVGGRLLGRSAISPLIQKQDQLNQLDSLVQLCVQRTSNPAWIIPENAGVEGITGEPGLIVKWNVLAAGGQGKPERVEGIPLDQSLFVFREQIIKDIEDLSGAFDIIKGQKPTGIEAFSALQLLVERSQSRFTSVFQARGEMYRRWFSIALELERQFGPDQRTWSVIAPNRGYTFKSFSNAQLQGQVTIQIEDGSNMPKTALGKRAAIEQANQLMLLDPTDPDQKYALLTQFGLSDLVPSLNYHVQAALTIQDEFEKWVENPIGPSPLVVKPWFDPMVHWTERIKWLNTDKMREILATTPALEPLITLHLQELQMVMAPPPQVDENGQPIEGGGPNQGGNAPGGGQGMTNSNKNSGSPKSSQPKGNKQHGPNVGPS